MLGVFQMDYASAYATKEMLANIVQNSDLSYDQRTNAVIAFATPDVLEVVKKAVGELDKETGVEVAFIPIKGEISSDVWQQLYRTAPRSVIIPARRTSQVIASGPKREIERIKAVLTAANAVGPINEEMIIHSFTSASPSTAVAVLAELFPGRVFRFYSSPGSLRLALEAAGFTGPTLWRPFLEEKVTDTAFIPVLPWPLGPEVLVLEKSIDFPPGELIPPVLLAPAARSLYDLAARIRNSDLPRYTKIEKVFYKSNSDGQKSIWRRRGIYLTLDREMDSDEYVSLFRCFLEGGFLIPPSPEEPVILPLSMSDGEESKLSQLLVN
jgi:hypothetical protein